MLWAIEGLRYVYRLAVMSKLKVKKTQKKNCLQNGEKALSDNSSLLRIKFSHRFQSLRPALNTFYIASVIIPSILSINSRKYLDISDIIYGYFQTWKSSTEMKWSNFG